jgi:hypothetical protein
MDKMNREDLIRIAKKSPTAEAIFTVLGARERARTDLDLRRLRNELVAEGFKVVPAAFEETFAELAKAGVVELKKEKGKATRTRFLMSPVTVGKIGVDGKPATPQLAVSPETPAVAPQAPIVAPARSMRVVCVLGSGRQARCEVPDNMSAEEAKFLAEAILQQAVG